MNNWSRLPKTKFEVLRRIAQKLEHSGLQPQVVAGTVCLFRPHRDKSTGEQIPMTSAQLLLPHRQRVARLFFTENRDQANCLRKYAIKLNTRGNETLREWHLSPAHGSHVH